MNDRLQPKSLDFLKRLLQAPSPSGFEATAARVWRNELETVADEISVDTMGNSLAGIAPDRAPRVLFTGHIDEIGLMITHIDDDGFLYFGPIGGWDAQVLVGQRVQIAGTRGPIVGVIGKPAIHLMKKEEAAKPSDFDTLWIDVGVASRREALKHVAIGDPAVLCAEVVDLPNSRIASRSIDNRIGAFVAAEALRRAAKRRGRRCGVYAMATVQEEISYFGGGARAGVNAVRPDVAVVIDVTHATDFPGADKKKRGDHRLGGGPVLSRGSAVNAKVFELLRETAEREKIPYTIEAAPRATGTDADSIQNVAEGIPTGLVSVPNRYMHSPNEMVSLRDLARAAQLLAAFASRVGPDTDFTPL